MKRLLAVSLVLLLILAACGESGGDPTPTPDDARQTGGTESTATVPETIPSPTAEAANPSEFDVIAFLVAGGGSERPQDSSEDDGVSTPDATPTTVSPAGEPTSTPLYDLMTPTHGDIPDVYYPDIPPVPEVASCEHAVDLRLSNLQLWLDGLVVVPVEVLRDGAGPPAGFERFTEQVGERMSAIEAQALQLGCITEELETRLLGRVDTLVANNSTAEWVLAMLRSEAEALEPEASPTPGAAEVEVDWTISTCAEAADVFIDRTQVLLLDALAGMTIAEIEALGEEDAPESIARFIQEFEQIRSSFLDIGCTEEDVTVLIGERIDQLAPQGEAAEELVMSLREAVADNALFEGLD